MVRPDKKPKIRCLIVIHNFGWLPKGQLRRGGGGGETRRADFAIWRYPALIRIYCLALIIFNFAMSWRMKVTVYCKILSLSSSKEWAHRKCTLRMGTLEVKIASVPVPAFTPQTTKWRLREM